MATRPFARFCAFAAVVLALVSPALARECHNPAHILMPPPQYRHEPHMAFTYVDAEVINTLLRKLGGREGQQVYGVFFPGPNGEPTILICRGVTGKALRLVRMHEEAHAMGWRHD